MPELSRKINGLFGERVYMLKQTLAVLLVLLIVFVRFSQIFIGLPYFDNHGHGNDCFFYEAGTKYIYEYPRSVFVCFGCWLSFITSNFFTDGSLLQLRVLQFFMDCGIYTTVFFLLRKTFGNIAVLIGLFFAALAQSSAFSEFSYNGYSVFFISLSVLLLVNGLRKQNNIYVFLSSLLLAINVLVRLPNVLDSLFVFLIPLYYYCYNNQGIGELVLSSKKSIVFFCLGYFVGLIACIVLLLCFNHFGYYCDFIDCVLFNKGKSAHGGSRIFHFFSINLITLCYYGLLLFFIYYVFACKLFGKVLILLLAAFILYKLDFYSYKYFDYRSYLLPYSVLSAVSYFVIKDKIKCVCFWIVFAFMLCLLFPIGSASPNSFIYPFLGSFAYPITVGTIFFFYKKYKNKVRYYFLFLFVLTTCLSVFIWARFPYFFVLDRFEILTTGKIVDNIGVVTNASDADKYNRYTERLKNYVDGKPVLTTDLFIHSTLNVKPFAIFISDWENPNPDKLLKDAYDEQKEMPVIVLYKNDTDMRGLLFSTDFVRKGRYKEVYSDDVFLIYRSDK